MVQWELELSTFLFFFFFFVTEKIFLSYTENLDGFRSHVRVTTNIFLYKCTFFSPQPVFFCTS